MNLSEVLKNKNLSEATDLIYENNKRLGVVALLCRKEDVTFTDHDNDRISLLLDKGKVVDVIEG